MAGQLKDFGRLSTAEKHLVEACKVGEPCVLGDGQRPEEPSLERSIRADLLRFLILGGGDDCQMHEWGVQLVGAHIGDRLDLSFAKAKGPTTFNNCTFAQVFLALQSRFEFLNLSGSSCLGLMAQSAVVKGGVFLNEGFLATGQVSLSAAKIGGQLNCSAGRFTNEQGDALIAESVQVAGDVFLDEGFSAKGQVGLAGARIEGHLACRGGHFEAAQGSALNADSAQVTGGVFLSEGFSAKGRVSLAGAKIGGQLNCGKGRFENPNGYALNVQSAQITVGLFWRDVSVSVGGVSFHSAFIGTLDDDLDSWPKPIGRTSPLLLDGMTYLRLVSGFHDVEDRLDWLSRGTIRKGEFYPQPYSQLAKVYREMGHHGDARAVLFEQERLRRHYSRNRRKILQDGSIFFAPKAMLAGLRLLPSWIWDRLLRHGVGYGYRPQNSLYALAVLWLAASWFAWTAWTEGSFAPNSDVIITSPGWTALLERDCYPATHPGCSDNPAQSWSNDPNAGVDWDSFNAWGYAADLVIPILDLGQTDAWAPSKDRGPWGWGLWWGRWLLAAAGWLVAGLGAAAITGIIKRE